MKKLLTFTILILIITSCIKELTCIDGNGIRENQVRNTGPFNEVTNTTQVDVIFHKADTIGITVSAESNLLNHIVTVIENNRLEIRTYPWNTCFDYRHKPVVIVTAPELSILRLTGSGNLTADSISGNSIEIELTGSGDLFTEHIICNDLAVTLTGSGDTEIRDATCKNAGFTLYGSGDVRIKGKSENGSMRISGSGDIDSDEFQLNFAEETITGSGNIFTDVQNSLKAVISGSGNIYLLGNPVVDQTLTGSGKIIRL